MKDKHAFPHPKYAFPKPRSENDDIERPRWPIPHPEYINNPERKPSEML